MQCTEIVKSMDEEGLALCNELADALNCGDKERIDKAKYDNLYYGSSLLTIISNYIALEDKGVHFDFGFETIKKGTKLYRIRRYNEDTDFNDSKEWNFPPAMPENRANKQGEPALYLGTTENICLLETHTKDNESYVLAEYEVLEDLTLGGFHSCDNYKIISHYLAGVILNAFLIAPSRNEKNDELFKFLDDYYKGFTINELNMSYASKLDLPLRFAVINKRNEFYKITNRLIQSIKEKYHDGISYSSCYIPMSTIGIRCSDYNVVLYKEGMNKIKFIQSSIKVSHSKFNEIDILKILVLKQNDK